MNPTLETENESKDPARCVLYKNMYHQSKWIWDNLFWSISQNHGNA